MRCLRSCVRSLCLLLPIATASACVELPGPGADETTLTVGPSGGTVTTPDGASVEVPPGALASETALTLRAVPASTLPPPGDGRVFAGAPYAFTPHGTTFQVPVTLRVPHEGAAAMLLRLDDEHDTTWESVPEAVFDGGFATVQSTRFSLYATARLDPAHLVACCSLPTDECGLAGDHRCDCGPSAEWEAADCPDQVYPEVLVGPGSISYVYGPKPFLFDGYVYSADGEGGISRVGLRPGATVERLYAEPGTQVTLLAVGTNGVYFHRVGEGFNTLGRMHHTGMEPDRTWVPVAPLLQSERGMVADGFLYLHVFPGYDYDGNGEEDGTALRISEQTGRFDPYPCFGSTITEGGACAFADDCLQSHDGGLALCGGREIDFAGHFATSIGRDDVVPVATSQDTWFGSVQDGTTTSLLGFRHGVHAAVAAGTFGTTVLGELGAPPRSAGANATHLYFWDDCHAVTWVDLVAEGHPQGTRDLLFSFEGPCVRWMHVDETHAYLDTWQLGLVRVELARLRGE